MNTLRFIIRQPIFYAALVLAACWPTCRWYAARMLDGSDEPWGVFALLGAGGFWVFSKRLAFTEQWRTLGCVGHLVMLWFLSGVLTPLLEGVLVAGALAFLLVDRRCWVGHTGLFFLSLPLISSLQFYGGYPLRWVIGKVSAAVLGAFGQSVEIVGTVMLWRGEMIVIDAPCSGVQMLWSSAFFACVLICIYKLDAWKSIKLLQVTSLTAFVANVVRNCLLFFVESGLVNVGDWAHDTIGVIVFVGALAIVGLCGKKLACKRKETSCLLDSPRPTASFEWIGRVGLCCVSVLIYVDRVPSRTLLFEGRAVASELSIGIDQGLLQEGWYPMVLDNNSAQFAKSFPGRIMTYEQDNRRLVVRVIYRATRRYHLSADCYRAIGYTIEPMNILKQADGSLWGRILATRNEEEVEVRERVVSRDGQEWTDPSSWFWSAVLSRSEGPWVAYSESLIR